MIARNWRGAATRKNIGALSGEKQHLIFTNGNLFLHYSTVIHGSGTNISKSGSSSLEKSRV